MPDKKEGGKALNGIVHNYELRKVKVGKKKRGSAGADPKLSWFCE
jgi:hypothetical protein